MTAHYVSLLVHTLEPYRIPGRNQAVECRSQSAEQSAIKPSRGHALPTQLALQELIDSCYNWTELTVLQARDTSIIDAATARVDQQVSLQNVKLLHIFSRRLRKSPRRATLSLALQKQLSVRGPKPHRWRGILMFTLLPRRFLILRQRCLFNTRVL